MILIDGLEYNSMYDGIWNRDPYVAMSNEHNLSSNPPRIPQHIRVYCQKTHTHMYCEYRYPQPGDTGLIAINFRRDDGHEFCFIDKWSSSVQGIVAHSPMRYDYMHHCSDGLPMMKVMIGDKLHHTMQYNCISFYKIHKTFVGDSTNSIKV
jgi:hypothetical protein